MDDRSVGEGEEAFGLVPLVGQLCYSDGGYVTRVVVVPLGWRLCYSDGGCTIAIRFFDVPVSFYMTINFKPTSQ